VESKCVVGSNVETEGPWAERNERAPGEKVLKKRRSPRRRGRTGTSVIDEKGRALISSIVTTAPSRPPSRAHCIKRSPHSGTLRHRISARCLPSSPPSSSSHVALPSATSASTNVRRASSVRRRFTSDRRGGVQRRQMELKGIEVCRD